VFKSREFKKDPCDQHQEPCANPRGDNSFGFGTSRSPGLQSIVGPNSHKRPKVTESHGYL
jgi:hypothetical protein